MYIARRAEDGKNIFGGAAYPVESRAELDRAIATTPSASSISKLDAPGGREIGSVLDPVGHKVHLVYGQTEKDAEPPHLEKLVVNYEDEKPQKGKFQRFEMGPARVHRWGHYRVTYLPGSYQTMFDWYTSKLALAVSDIVYKDGNPMTCFFHIDRGMEFTDHHAFFKQAKSEEELKVFIVHIRFMIMIHSNLDMTICLQKAMNSVGALKGYVSFCGYLESKATDVF